MAERSLSASARTPLKRRLWKRLLEWKFRLVQRHRYDALVLEEVAGRPFLLMPQVFNPALFESSQFLARSLDALPLPPAARVLDMGTGSGIGAVFAAQRASHVSAVDINPAAVRCARINVLLNGVEARVVVHQGDLFAPVAGERFDLVLFNPPYFRGTPRDALDHAWRGTDVVERFATALPAHLTATGSALVVLSTDGDAPAFLQAFRAARLDVQPFRQWALAHETLTIYHLRPHP